MSDDEYVEGDSTSEAADAPGTIPSDDTPSAAREPAKQGGFDSSSVSDAPVIRRSTKTAHTAEARKAFAAAVLANKSKPAPAPTGEVAELDPEAAPAEPIAAKADVRDAKAAAADPPKPPPSAADILAAPAPAAPPAPSLDPEVRRLKEQLAAEREQLAKERAELDKRKAEPAAAPQADALDFERYIDHAPKSYRTWLETMRGEPMSDDDFKAELSDFITQASADVLGVPLPEATRTKLDAALARKAVRTSKTIMAKREAARIAAEEKARAEAAERASAEEVERQWTQAAQAVGQQFAPTQDATGAPVASQAAATYPWLAAEDEPGKIVVDVIRAAMQRDGTQMSWQEASKKANDFLAEQAKRYYDKRKPLLGESKPAPTTAAKPAAPVTPPPADPPPPPKPAAPQKWSRERHMENTKAAFRKAVSGQ